MAATLDALKRHLGEQTTGRDALLTDILDGAVATFERATARRITAPVVGDPETTVTRPVVGCVVQLPDARSVSAIVGPASETVDLGEVRLQGWNHDGTSVWAVLPEGAPDHVTVTGRFGLTPLPADVREAVVLLAAHRYRMRGAEAAGSWQPVEDGIGMDFGRLPPAYLATVKAWRVPQSPIQLVSLGGA